MDRHNVLEARTRRDAVSVGSRGSRWSRWSREQQSRSEGSRGSSPVDKKRSTTSLTMTTTGGQSGPGQLGGWE